MEVFYSTSTGGFYSKAMHGNGIPGDAKSVTLDHYKSLLKEQAFGKLIVGDDSGFPIAVQPAAPTVESLLFAVKNELRSMRAPMLDALTGIAGRAARAGNEALAIEVYDLSEQLLDITDDPALNAATDYESMRAAGVAAYKRIAASASDDLKVVFREITGV